MLQLVDGIARERGATVVLSTHFLGEVEDTCSRVLILNRGRVVAEGSVAEVTRRAAAPRRARFRVPAELRDRALDALARVPGLAEAQPLDGRPDWVAASLKDAGEPRRPGACERSGARAGRRGGPGAGVRARGHAAERRVPRDDGGGLRWSRAAGPSSPARSSAICGSAGAACCCCSRFSVLVSAITYVGATSEGINFLEKRETVNLTLQVAIAFGALVALLAAADAISGERERGTLESLLLTPVRRRHLVSGKLLAAVSLWFASLIVAVPYIWFLGRDVGAVDDAIAAGLLVGTLVAVSLTAFGMIVSALASTNRAEPVGQPVRPAGAVRAHAAARRARSRGGPASCCSA